MDAEQRMSDQPDRWIDAALAEFSQAEPLAGIEERVLARLQASLEAPAHRQGFVEILLSYRGIPATALTSVTLIAFLWWITIGGRQQPSTGGQVAPAFAAGNAQLGSAQVILHNSVEPVAQTHRSSAQRSLPKLAVFPTPSPLSPQERTLVALARQQPGVFQQVPMEDSQYTSLHGEDSSGTQAAEVVPMEIEKIKIEPLPAGGAVEEEQ
jgi:hypothetical protein